MLVKQVLWTATGKKSFDQIILWLKENWSDKEVVRFVTKTEHLINNLELHPETCRPSLKRKNVRIAILDKHTQLIYHYDKKLSIITILLFWGMKQNPSKLKY
jgi:plasmid stabilization system protein ParE